MRLWGAKTVARGLRYGRSRFVRGGLVLLYHRVDGELGDEVSDPFALRVTTRRFEEHLETLQRMATVMGLREMTEAAQRGDLPPRPVAVTFDDGYVDNLLCAKPLLERFGLPATMFAVSGCLDRSFWWEDLVEIICSPRELPLRLRLELPGGTLDWRTAQCDRQRLVARIHPRLRDLGERERCSALAALGSWSGVERPAGAAAAAGRRPLTRRELTQLAEGGLIEVGAHGVSHRALSTLSTEDQRQEIGDCKAALETVLARPVTSFSYPFGMPGDWSRETEALLKASGFERACTNVSDMVHRGSDPYRLPRYWVNDWAGQEFARRLERWLGA